MNYFIKNIKINRLYHLQDFNIPISNEETPHLLITGKNGSGKTVLLNAVADFLDAVKDDSDLNFTRQAFDKVEVEFSNVAAVIDAYKNEDFILAFYQADRKIRMKEPANPVKPSYSLKTDIKTSVTEQFLYFLSDLKIQEALARNEGMIDDADKIHTWFDDFESLLQQIYQDKELRLEFKYQDYSFWINSEGKRFKFTQTSDGFAAVLDMVADLILKMQAQNSLTRAYEKKGIVLIDEVETHLHLELQKIIMPLLTRIFPNIQFIVTTHSPFVLNSMENAIAFDLEHQEVIDELTAYSYESLAEGYFGVSTASSYMQMQLEQLKTLLEKDECSASDKQHILQLVDDFDKVPESVSPALVGQYLSLKTSYFEKLKSIKA